MTTNKHPRLFPHWIENFIPRHHHWYIGNTFPYFNTFPSLTAPRTHIKICPPPPIPCDNNSTALIFCWRTTLIGSAFSRQIITGQRTFGRKYCLMSELNCQSLHTSNVRWKYFRSLGLFSKVFSVKQSPWLSSVLCIKKTKNNKNILARAHTRTYGTHIQLAQPRVAPSLPLRGLTLMASAVFWVEQFIKHAASCSWWLINVLYNQIVTDTKGLVRRIQFVSQARSTMEYSVQSLILNFVIVLIFVRSEVTCQVRSITRGTEDTFVLKASSGCRCADFHSSNISSDPCSCRCHSDAPTFYSRTKENQIHCHCLSNLEVLSDAQSKLYSRIDLDLFIILPLRYFSGANNTLIEWPTPCGKKHDLPGV